MCECVGIDTAWDVLHVCTSLGRNVPRDVSAKTWVQEQGLQICGDMPEGEVSVLGCALEMCVHRALHKCRAVSYSLGVCKLQSVFVIL